WTQVEGEIRFASEIQALLVFPDQPRRLNPTAAALYAALGYVPAPHTMFAGIAKLEPGHVLVAHEGGVTERRYWDAAAVAAGPSRLDAPATLRATLLRAVERELMSDVPVGVFTSGGLDSSLLAAAAARVVPGAPLHTYLGHKAAALFQRTPGRAVLRWLVNRLPTSTGKVTLEFLLKQLVAAAESPPVDRHLTWFGALGPDRRTLAWATGLLDRFPADGGLNRLLWLDFLSYLPDNLLVKVDRGTMLASLEARAPYLDRAVLELVLPAPVRLKVRGLTTKAILKEAARGLVPDDLIGRRKRGLSVPVARWLNGGLAALADRYLAAPRLYPDAPTARLLAEHRAGKSNNARKLWPILMAELWAERWNVEIG